jgi:hypothetical protein
VAVIDLARGAITLNVMYFGPRQSGCGTNVRQLHRAQAPQRKAELQQVGHEERNDRIWFFVTPTDQAAPLGDFDIYLQVASVPSAAEILMEREPFIDGVDGIVFVADARAHRHEENIAALLDLQSCVQRRGLELGSLPLVFQVNQTDHPNARPIARVLDELDAWRSPRFEAMARQGKGVLETWSSIQRLVLGRLVENAPEAAMKLTVSAMSRASREADTSAVLHHALTLPQANKALPDLLVTSVPAEVVLAPEELIGAQPIHVLSTEVRAGRIRVEALVRRAGGESRKLCFVLEPSVEGAHQHPEDITQPIHLGPGPPTASYPTERDLSATTYGVLGAIGGLIAGMLATYIFLG